MSADAVQVYCATSRELTQLRDKTRADLREVREARKAAQAVLLELHDDHEVVAELPDGAFCLRVRTTATRPPQTCDVLQQMVGFWEDGGATAWRRELERDPTLDPVDALVERIIEHAWPPAVVRRALDVRPAKLSAARLQDLPAAPPTSSELAANIVAAKALVSTQLSAMREEKARLAENLKEAESRVIPELQQLPAGVVRKVSFNEDEAFFLRLKRPRKQAPPRFSCAKVRKALKAALAERANLPSRAALLDRLVDPAFGATLCQDVAGAFASQALPPDVTPRVAMDRLRSCA